MHQNRLSVFFWLTIFRENVLNCRSAPNKLCVSDVNTVPYINLPLIEWALFEPIFILSFLIDELFYFLKLKLCQESDLAKKFTSWWCFQSTSRLSILLLWFVFCIQGKLQIDKGLLGLNKIASSMHIKQKAWLQLVLIGPFMISKQMGQRRSSCGFYGWVWFLDLNSSITF